MTVLGILLGNTLHAQNFYVVPCRNEFLYSSSSKSGNSPFYLLSPHSAAVGASCKRDHSVCLWCLISLSVVFGIHARCSICQLFLCF